MSGSVSAGVVTFNTYPSTNRVPGVYFEVDASQANTGQINQRSLIVAQMLSTGTATANVPVISTGVGDAVTQFGAGSMMMRMVQAYRNADIAGELWCLPVVDESGGVQAIHQLTYTGPATAAGSVALYVAGQNIPVAVASGDTASTIATNTVTAVNATPNLPVVASALSGVVSFTARHKGVMAGDCDVRVNYFGYASNEVLPAGVGATVVLNQTAGTTDPTATHLTTALANLADMAFDFIVWPYNTTASLASIESFLSDQSGRWSYVSELFGMAWSAYRGQYSSAVTYGLTNNNQHVSVLPFYDSPTCVYEVAADYAATCAVSVRADPALPLQNIALSTMKAPPVASRWYFAERNTLLYSGLSTFRVNQGGAVILERATTTYQLNAQGGADDSYLDVESLYTLQFLMRNLRVILQTKFARVKLVADGTRVPFGANFVTAQTVGGEVIAWYRKMAGLALVQNPDEFAKQLVAQNAGNGQVSILAPIQLANQLRVIAVLVQFTKP